MEKILVIHGRQPGLGVAELESIYGSGSVSRIGSGASLVRVNQKEFNFSRFGGMVKFCKVLLELDTVEWSEITKFLCQASTEHSKKLEDGRLTIGLSVYGLNTDKKSVNDTAIKMKKAIKETGRSVRVVPNKELTLNTAQVLHNKLTQKLGWELVFMRNGSKTIVAQSIAVQDIEKYTARDQNRPYRDAKIGMLPPKLAQIIINLAVGSPGLDLKIYDAFCGTGVILQEALIMGHEAIGSDINPRMVEYSEKNLKWLTAQGSKVSPIGAEANEIYSLSVADATKVKLDKNINSIAGEIFLGPPLSIQPDLKILSKITKECSQILEKFLKNVQDQTRPGFRMCLAIPAWKSKNGFNHLPTLDKLPNLGYNRVKFVHISNDELVYHRPGQIVARELVVLERK
ncbi:MAG: hypothetical protein WD885_01985 [Candidatus Saccharimonadales bacterium]